MDIPAYLARIGYVGPRVPTLATLDAIIARHVENIPFENLDVLLNRSISIELPDIENKLVRQRRGGYCFEHNTLLLHALEGLGFSVTVLGARSCYQRPERNTLPRTHVLLRVELEGESYLVDGGFGGLSPTAALRVATDIRQETPHEPRRILREGSWEGLVLRAPDAVLVHQALLGDTWHDLYAFTLERMPPADREMGNWYTSAHPRSHFRDHLMVARSTPDGRMTLHDRELTWRPRDGHSKSRILQTYEELLDALAEHFELVFAHDTRFECTTLSDLP